MEFQKRLISQREQRQHQKEEKEKHQFFTEVFNECANLFQSKQFEFFSNYIIPQHAKNGYISANSHRQSQSSNMYRERDSDINDINPYVLIMPRRQNFYAEHGVKDLYRQKKNRRILTTPTQKVKHQINFDNYEELQFYKKMKKQYENFGVYSKISESYRAMSSKMYSPQKIFYPAQKFQMPKTVLQMNVSKMKKVASNRTAYLQSRKENMSLEEDMNIQSVPRTFIQNIKFSKKYPPFTKSYTKLATSMR